MSANQVLKSELYQLIADNQKLCNEIEKQQVIYNRLKRKHAELAETYQKLLIETGRA